MNFDIKTSLWIITLILTFVGYFPYIRDIFRGKTKPHLYSWLVWGIFALVIFSIQTQHNAGAGSWMTGLIGLICLFVAWISLKYGTKNITRADHLFLWGAIIALLSWFFIDDSSISLVLICAIDVLGFLPTIRKSWLDPYDETLILYITAALRYGLSIIALAAYTIDTMLYPSLWFIINTLFCIYLVVRRNIVIK